MSVRIPKYRLHKASGQALVQISGCRTYLGKHGTPESRERYRRLIAEWLCNGQASPGSLSSSSTHQTDGKGVSINELVLAYWHFAVGYYRKNGEPTGEIDNIRAALRPLRRLYGCSLGSEFGPDALELIQEEMIRAGLSRKVINARVSRIKRMFRWASRKRLVPPEIYAGLMAVDGLRRGRSGARETEPVKPVPVAHVAAVLPHVTVPVRVMIQIQELTGMRPQDVRNMRTCDLDMASDVWVYTPWTHKTEHHGHVRRVAIGPKAQDILQPFLKQDHVEAYVFSPKEAVAAVRSERVRRRKTRPTPSERLRKMKQAPKRSPGDQYTKTGYETAVRRACKRTDIPPWAPNQLRHTCATKVRKRYGVEGAAAVLGNSLGMVAEVYAEANFELAIKIMREMG